MTAKSILSMNYTTGSRELGASELTGLEKVAALVSLAYEMQSPQHDEASRAIGNNIEADALHALVDILNTDPAHVKRADAAMDDEGVNDPTEDEADAVHNYITAAEAGDAFIAEKTAEHADWLDNQRTQEDARY